MKPARPRDPRIRGTGDAGLPEALRFQSSRSDAAQPEHSVARAALGIPRGRLRALQALLQFPRSRSRRRSRAMDDCGDPQSLRASRTSRASKRSRRGRHVPSRRGSLPMRTRSSRPETEQAGDFRRHSFRMIAFVRALLRPPRRRPAGPPKNQTVRGGADCPSSKVRPVGTSPPWPREGFPVKERVFHAEKTAFTAATSAFGPHSPSGCATVHVAEGRM